MANKLENITIVFVSGKLQGKTVLNENFTMTEGYKKGDNIRGFFSVQYTPGGTGQAFWNYMQKPLARAGGYGYAKDGVCFAQAVNKIYGTEFDNHGEGLDHTIEEMKAQGFAVKRMYEVF